MWIIFRVSVNDSTICHPLAFFWVLVSLFLLGRMWLSLQYLGILSNRLIKSYIQPTDGISPVMNPEIKEQKMSISPLNCVRINLRDTLMRILRIIGMRKQITEMGHGSQLR